MLNRGVCLTCPFVEPGPWAGVARCFWKDRDGVVDGRDIAEHEARNFCPDGREAQGAAAMALAVPTTVWAMRGPELWAELHRWATDADLSHAAEWLAAFADRLGCGECRSHWLAWVAEHVPATGDRAALLRWTIAGHNAVNERLGKRVRGFEEMVNYWALHGL